MLVIRKEQWDALGAAAKRAFEDEMVVHLSGFSPPLFKAVGEDQMRRVIRLGMLRAADHSLRNRGPVRFYLEMMLLFGSYFDTDPQYPWAKELLGDRDRADEMYRAERLYEKTMEYRHAVGGKEDVYTLRALRVMARIAEGELPSSGRDVIAIMQRRIAMIYPEKAEFVGATAMEALIREGAAAAQSCGFPSERAQTLMVVLMLAFGHGCTDDPLYPWIGQTLRDPAIGNPEARAKRLEGKALTWLRHVLANFDATTVA